MATSVTQSLFGMTPQSIQAQRDADLQAQALRFAQLTPMQQAQMGLFTAGSRLGTGIAQALGAEDPEMAQARARQGLLGGVDMNDPQSLLTLARNIQGTDPQAAQMLVMQANELAGRQATVRKTEAEMMQEQQGFQTRFEALRRRLPELSEEEARALALDEVAFREVFKTPKVDTQVVETAQGQILINKQTGQPIANLGPAPDRATRVNVSVAPTIKQAGDTIGLVKGYEDLTKPEREMLKSAQTSKELINNAASSNNSQAWEAARTQIAKAVGEGKLSNEDIRRTGVDPRLVQGALDWVNKKVEGVPNQSIMQQLYTVASILERTSVDRINQSAQRTRSAARVAGVPEAEMDVMFPLIPTDRSPRRQAAGSTQTSRGTKYQIIED